MGSVILHVIPYQYSSIAFPAIGCGEHNCSVDVIVETMVHSIRKELKKRKLAWTVKFIIEHHKQNVYNEFCRQASTPEKSKTLIRIIM